MKPVGRTIQRSDCCFSMMTMPKILTNYFLMLTIALAPLQAFAVPMISASGEPCAMHQSGKTDLPSSECPDCNGDTCNTSDCAPDHCVSSHSQFSISSAHFALPVSNPEIRSSIFFAEINSRSDPPLLRPPV